jgi:Class II flagellar assembly regulator
VVEDYRSDHQPMKIYGANALAAPAAAPSARRTAGGTFKLASDGAQAATASGAVRTVSGIDALLVLQGVEDATERRKRAVRKGRAALDALEELKLGVLSGTLEPESLRRLKVLGGEIQCDTGDPRLDGVLGEIRLRVEVELAKAGIE